MCYKNVLSFIVVAFFYLLLVATSTNDPAKEMQMNDNEISVTNGACSFIQYCKTCHVPPDQKVTDNPLDGLFERLPQPADTFFIKFVSDSRSLRSQGNQYAMAVYQSWGSNYDHRFKDVFSKKEFTALLLYIKHHTQ